MYVYIYIYILGHAYSASKGLENVYDIASFRDMQLFVYVWLHMYTTKLVFI